MITIEKNIGLYKCPVCGDKMHLHKFKSIICKRNHCFDIAKTGYINLLLKPPRSQYDKKLFNSRKVISDMGFFNPLLDATVALIEKNLFNKGEVKNQIKILDAGCGDGFHLAQIVSRLENKFDIPIQGAGIDISRDGIQIASKNYKGILWCVANLAEIPFRDQQFDVILNILSPFNYQEFCRIGRKDGILIKVIPGKNYLKELREVLFKETDRESYSNQDTISHFSSNFKIIDSQDVNYNLSINQEELKHLIQMTPLSWHTKKAQIDKILKDGLTKITGDFKVLVGVIKK